MGHPVAFASRYPLSIQATNEKSAGAQTLQDALPLLDVLYLRYEQVSRGWAPPRVVSASPSPRYLSLRERSEDAHHVVTSRHGKYYADHDDKSRLLSP